ncbi:MAG: hypothetical protein KC457_09560, partial [Myxococcales bacterium]|nr:hypothetical protein [Myxococcales bacterium]
MSDARVKSSIHGPRTSIALVLTLAACTPAASGSVSEQPTSEVKPEPTAPEPFDPRPRALAPYQGGSSCNLVHDGDSLYWLLQGFEARSARPVTASEGTTLAAVPSTAATSMGA